MLAPLDFVGLLLATLSGYPVFTEWPNIVSIVGAMLVAGGPSLQCVTLPPRGP